MHNLFYSWQVPIPLDLLAGEYLCEIDTLDRYLSMYRMDMFAMFVKKCHSISAIV